jgi:hypothetical protein
MTVSGTTIIGQGTSGTLNITSSTGTKTFTGDVTINNGANFTETAASTLSFGSNITNNGAYNASTGTHTFSGSAKTFNGSITIPNTTISGTYTNNGVLTVTTALAGSGTLTNGATGTLNIGDGAITPTLTATAVGNTVNYNGTAQTVKATTYYNLVLSGSGAKTMASGVSTNNNLSIAPTGSATASISSGVTLTINNLTLGGILKVPGTWGSSSSTATYKNDTYFSATTGRLNVTTGASSIATITSSIYSVSANGTSNETITSIPHWTTKTNLIANLIKGESHQTWNDSGIHDPVLFGDKLVVTAQDNATIVTYTITVWQIPTAVPPGNNAPTPLNIGPTSQYKSPGAKLSVGTTMNPMSTLDVRGNMAIGTYAGTTAAPSNGLIVSGNVGVGTNSPTTNLDVNGTIRIRGGSPATGTVLITDATGLAHWGNCPTGPSGPQGPQGPIANPTQPVCVYGDKTFSPGYRYKTWCNSQSETNGCYKSWYCTTLTCQTNGTWVAGTMCSVSNLH